MWIFHLEIKDYNASFHKSRKASNFHFLKKFNQLLRRDKSPSRSMEMLSVHWPKPITLTNRQQFARYTPVIGGVVSGDPWPLLPSPNVITVHTSPHQRIPWQLGGAQGKKNYLGSMQHSVIYLPGANLQESPTNRRGLKPLIPWTAQTRAQ